MQKSTPANIDQLQAAVAALNGIIGSGLLALYLHGSAVSGGLRPQSDIDLLAIVDHSLSDAQRSGLVTALLHISGRHPSTPGGPRCIEVVVFHESALLTSAFPARVDFVYGEWLREGFEAGEVPVPTSDPEYTLLLAQARQQSALLLGRNILERLPEIPVEQVQQAMRNALPFLLEGLRGDARNVLLTLARMWRTASTGEFVTKDAAAAWAIPQLPAQEASTLNYARQAYLGELADEWEGRFDDAKQLAERVAACLTLPSLRDAETDA